MHAKGSVRIQAEPFLGDIGLIIAALPDKVQAQTTNTIQLLNASLLNPEPLAQLVLAISAVEMLGRWQKWSKAQRHLLNEL
jgi:hypothetical protein